MPPLDMPIPPTEKPERPLTQAALIKALIAGGARSVIKRAKAVVFVQGEPADSIYFIVRGRVETTVVSRQGKEGAIALCTKGDFVGEASLTPLPLYLDSASAVTDCELLVMSSAQMRALLHKKRAASLYFTNFLLQRTLDVQADLVDHLFNSSEKRLARVLLLLANFGHEGRLEPITNVTHDMLAQRVGTTRARVSFFMNKFRRLGLIDYNGTIKVHSGLLNVVLYDSRLVPEKP
jgi:CRP/FNR family transcriptional regulator, cyclic AMP receptor protein